MRPTTRRPQRGPSTVAALLTAMVLLAGSGLIAESYDLRRDERRGGHTLARHVGRSDADLRDRLRREGGISAASTFTDRTTAERVVFEALERERHRVAAWLDRRGPRPNLAFGYRSPGRESIGRSLRRGAASAVQCWDARIVLRWDRGRDFYVLTAYPEARR